jgi:hypothetical protein
MPCVHLYVQDPDEIEELEELEDWDALVGLSDGDERHEQRSETHGRGERRYGGSEAVARKREERRKQFHRRRN